VGQYVTLTFTPFVTLTFMQYVTLTFTQYVNLIFMWHVTLSESEGSLLTKRIMPILATKHW